MTEFQRKVKRMALGLRQADVARALGCNRTYIPYMENTGYDVPQQLITAYERLLLRLERERAQGEQSATGNKNNSLISAAEIVESKELSTFEKIKALWRFQPDGLPPKTIAALLGVDCVKVQNTIYSFDPIAALRPTPQEAATGVFREGANDE